MNELALILIGILVLIGVVCISASALDRRLREICRSLAELRHRPPEDD